MTERRTHPRRSEDVKTQALADEVLAARRRLLRTIGVIIGAAVIVGLGIGSCQRTNAIDESDYQTCREANLPNGYLRLTIQRYLPDRARADAFKKLPILWCRRTVELDRPVRLRPREEQRWLDVFRRDRLPLVDDDSGRVLRRSEPLPAPPR